MLICRWLVVLRLELGAREEAVVGTHGDRGVLIYLGGGPRWIDLRGEPEQGSCPIQDIDKVTLVAVTSMHPRG